MPHLKIFWRIFRLCAYLCIKAVLVDSSLGLTHSLRVCSSVCPSVAAMQRAQVMLKTAKRISYPSRGQCGPYLRDGSVFHGLPVSFKRPHSTSFASPCGKRFPVSAPKYIRPRCEGGLWLFFFFFKRLCIIKSKTEKGLHNKLSFSVIVVKTENKLFKNSVNYS